MTTLTNRDHDLFEQLRAHGRLTTTQISALFCPTESNVQRIRRRLQKLRNSTHIKVLDTPINVDNTHVLLQKGMDALSNARHVAPRRVTSPRKAQYREHDSLLSDLTVSFDLMVDEIENAELLIDDDILARSPYLNVRAQKGWKVSLAEDGATFDHWVKPDRLRAVRFIDRPTDRDTRYFAFELDTGTMPLTASNLSRASIARKLIAFDATYRDKVLQNLFAIDHCYYLFSAPGARRRDNMVKLTNSLIKDDKVANSILFAVHAKPPTVGFYENLSSMTWINGRGKKVSLPL